MRPPRTHTPRVPTPAKSTQPTSRRAAQSGKEDHCKLCGCKGCGFCGGSIARPNEELVGSVAAAAAVAVAAAGRADDKWYCYALRYPDLLAGFCSGDVEVQVRDSLCRPLPPLPPPPRAPTPG